MASDVTVVAAILVGDRGNGAAAGVIAGLALLGYLRWWQIARFNAENADMAVRWRVLRRSERRTLKRAVRGRGPIPIEHTALLEDQIAAVEELWQQAKEKDVRQGRALAGNVGGIVSTCVMGALLAFTAGGDRVGTVLGFTAVGLGVTVGAGFAAAVVQSRRWARRWPARLRELRAELEAMPHPRD